MSLVERLFPPSELAAMKHAVLAAADEPAAKRRRISRPDSVHSHATTDSGYNSDSDKSDKFQSSYKTLHPAPRKSSIAAPASPTHSVSSPMSDEEDFCDKIARARARLYSNASLSVPSPPASDSASPTGVSDSLNDEYHSPVCAEPATTSGCNMGTFLSLGMALTTHERNLLTNLVPEPRAMPSWSSHRQSQENAMQLKIKLARLQHQQQQERLRAARQTEQQKQQRRSSYAGFAISLHDEEDEETVSQPKTVSEPAAHDSPKPVETVDDFFNIEEASEEGLNWGLSESL